MATMCIGIKSRVELKELSFKYLARALGLSDVSTIDTGGSSDERERKPIWGSGEFAPVGFRGKVPG